MPCKIRTSICSGTSRYCETSATTTASWHFGPSSRVEATWTSYAIKYEEAGYLLDGRKDIEFLASGFQVRHPGAVPLFYARVRSAPYRYGLSFVHTLRRLANNHDVVDQAFVDLPQSTQQILHPERYLAPRWYPFTFSWPRLESSLRDWRLVDENTLGELMT